MESAIFVRQCGNAGAAVKAGNHASSKGAGGGGSSPSGSGADAQQVLDSFLANNLGNINRELDADGLVPIPVVRDRFSKRNPNASSSDVTKMLLDAQSRDLIQLTGGDLSSFNDRQRGVQIPGGGLRYYIRELTVLRDVA